MMDYSDAWPNTGDLRIAIDPVPPPSINFNHIDGPYIHFSDGQIHFLTIWERFLVWIVIHDAASLQRKLRPMLELYLKTAPAPFARYRPDESMGVQSTALNPPTDSSVGHVRAREQSP